MTKNKLRILLVIVLLCPMTGFDQPSPALADTAANGPGGNFNGLYAGDSTTYTRGTFRNGGPIPGTPSQNYKGLRSRGYINDICLRVDYRCLAKYSLKYREEATAQAKVIQRLGGGAGLPLSPNPTSSAVQWEVAPTNDGECAPEVVTKPPLDVEVQESETPQATPSAPSGCLFRVDVLRGDPAGTSFNIIEVKHWKGDGRQTISDVNAQLSRYENNAPRVGVRFDRDISLMRWSRSYRDFNGDTWCVWGGRQDAGHVYFARWAATPKVVRDRSDGGDGCNLDVRYGIEPRQQHLTTNGTACPANWGVTVAVPAAPSQLKFEDGLGAPQTVAIPTNQGSTVTLEFSRDIPADARTYSQTATVIINGTPQPVESNGRSTASCRRYMQEQVKMTVLPNEVATIPVTVAGGTQVTVAYGDGATETVTAPVGDSTVTYNFQHAYATAGPRPVTATAGGVQSTSTIGVGVPANISPARQVANEQSGCYGSYQMRVARPLAKVDATQSQTLRMEFGDGSSQDFQIPAGSGDYYVSAYHYFDGIDAGIFYQRATILETGAFSESSTIHEPFSAITVGPTE